MKFLKAKNIYVLLFLFILTVISAIFLFLNYRFVTLKEKNTYPSNIQTYTNTVFNYSLSYSSNYGVGAFDGFEGPIEKADSIYLANLHPFFFLFSIRTVNTPSSKKFDNDKDAIADIVEYFSGSTSEFLSPELNKVSKPQNITVGNYSKAIKYSIDWEVGPSDGELAKGTEVWIYIPTKTKNMYLRISYDIKNEIEVLNILSTFKYSDGAI